VFLHEKGIAHRDCVAENIMMDADAMYPEGFHPVNLDYTPDFSGPAVYTARTLAGAKYYFVDFGISVYIPESNPPALVTGHNGRDQDPPELSDDIPYDPFKLDIFIIGNMFDRDFCQPFSNLEFFRPLIKAMVRPDPSERPDAKEALDLWKGIRGSLWAFHREWRPRPRTEHPIGAVILDVISLRQLVTSFAKSVAERIYI